MTTTKIVNYDESNIDHLEGLEGIRKRPTMYINAIGQDGTFHLAVEATGNIIDEFQAGRASELIFILDEKDGSMTAMDDGVGIPVGKIESVMTNLHSSGKFDDKAYGGFSIGLNGVGLKAINALSTETLVIVKRDGYKYQQKFSKGKAVSELEKLGKATDTGTTVKFKPDESILKDVTVDHERLMTFLKRISYLNPGLTVKLFIKPLKGNPINKEYYSENGIVDLFHDVETNPLVKPIYFKGEVENMMGEVVLSYNVKNDYENLFSFANGVETIEHGTHVNGFKIGLTEAVKKFINDSNILTKKDGKLEITGDDVREGVVAIIKVKHNDALFAEQAKKKLTNMDVQGFIKKLVSDEMTEWLNKNKNEAKRICQHIINCAKGRVAAKNAKNRVVKKTDGIPGISSLSKLTEASSDNPLEKELYLVEGNECALFKIY